MKKLSTLALLILLPCFASAEISNPYVIDEKPQVFFGDSGLVTFGSTAYQGLENYTHDYVNNFLHITFSYSHAQCCTASYPPSLYTTNANPSATSTFSIRDDYHIFPLSSQPTHLTGIYFYDIQFDSTGYTAKVTASTTSSITEVANFHRNITGLNQSSDYTALGNYYPRQNPVNQFSASFTPLPIYYSTPAPILIVATTTPVIIVPGIMGTEIFDNENNLIWLNTFKLAASFTDGFLEELKAESANAGKIIRNTGGKDYFSGLFSILTTNGYTENTDSFENPYDWRLDLEASVQDLKNKIDKLKAERGVNKVDLVAHSMGGLLIKKYLHDYGGSSVGKFIDIGTPHTGSPKSYKILTYGDNLGASFLFGLFGINADEIKSISQNMPSVYQLLPSRNYLTQEGGYVFNIDNALHPLLNYDETKEFMKGSGRNSTLVDRADAFHTEIDDLNPADYGVETYNIVGCGVPTIGKFFILDSNEDHPSYNMEFTNGDGTVPLISALALTASSTYYVRGIAHALLPSTSGVKELVANLLTASTSSGQAASTFDLTPYSTLSTTPSGCTIPNGKVVSFHSPITLDVYDTSGNHAGPDANGDIEENIPGVVYEVIGDNKFAFLPSGTEYTVKGSATSAGSFDARVEEIMNGQVASTTIFANIPLTPTTQAKFNVTSNPATQINLDSDNDGVFEGNAYVTTSTSGSLTSTGKLATIPSATPTSSSAATPGSSVIKNLTTTPRATSSVPIITPTSSVSPTTSTPTKNPRIVKSTQKAPATTSTVPTSITSPYQNTAVVYKSFNGKLKKFFQSIWHKLRGQ